jgi:aspartyl-tRNA(Asn)/glutamyl-tRNA(Gln) amidotransferase subunit C
MSLTTSQVSHIAKLSRLNLTQAETEKFRNQMAGILEYIKKLDEIDTSTVEPTVNTTGIQNRLREDKVGTSFSSKEATANAASHNDTFFIVPNVFE